MTEQKRRLTERIVDPGYMDGLRDKSIAELKEMRTECRDGENEISFERRLSQGRVDILKAELIRRKGGGEDEDLVAKLPEILGGGQTRSSDNPLPSRAPDFSTPRSADVPRRRVDEIAGEQTLARLRELDEDEIERILQSLAEYEEKLSSKRKQVHTVMDEIQAEIVRRYQSGEADPTEALG
jgi:hypothetical protein